MFDVAHFITITTSIRYAERLFYLHVSGKTPVSFLYYNKYFQKCVGLQVRWHLKVAVLPIGPRYMYLCLSPSFIRRIQMSLVFYMYKLTLCACYDIPVCPIQSESSPMKTSTKRHRNTARNRKYQYGQSKVEVDIVPQQNNVIMESFLLKKEKKMPQNTAFRIQC